MIFSKNKLLVSWFLAFVSILYLLPQSLPSFLPLFLSLHPCLSLPPSFPPTLFPTLSHPTLSSLLLAFGLICSFLLLLFLKVHSSQCIFSFLLWLVGWVRLYCSVTTYFWILQIFFLLLIYSFILLWSEKNTLYDFNLFKFIETCFVA